MNKQAQIHPTAIVAEDVIIGKGTVIHPFAVIASGVVLGENNVIGKGVSIHENVRLGNNNLIGVNAVIGIDPSNITFNRTQETGVFIGDNNVIKEFVTIERSAKLGENTKIGNKNLLMVNSHVAHDCVIEDEVVIANYSALAGHVLISSNTFISGGCLVHQYVRIGKGVMVGALSKVSNDVPPYIMVEGYTGRYRGLNIVGLKRLGFNFEQRNLIKKIYHYLYQGVFSEGVAKIERIPSIPIRDEILKFLKNVGEKSIVRRCKKKSNVDLDKHNDF